MNRPNRYMAEKVCERCETLKRAEEYPKVRGGGTSDICNECKRAAVAKAMAEFHERKREELARRQQEHFDRELANERARWDALPDGHPYKAPKRP
jgi:hypothetical protein